MHEPRRSAIEWLSAQPSRLLFSLTDPAYEKLSQYFDLLGNVFDTDAVGFFARTENSNTVLVRGKIESGALAAELTMAAEWVIDQNESLVVCDLVQDNRVSSAPDANFNAMVAFPVHIGRSSKVLGALVVALPVPGQFLQSELDSFQNVVNLFETDIARIIDANRDPQTSLNNRDGFVTACKHVLELCRRVEHEAAIVVFEIPAFEKLHTTHGEEFCDLMIRNLAALVYKTLRSSDVVARLDSNSVVALLPHNKNFDVFVIFKRFVKSLKELNESLCVAAGDSGEPLNPIVSYLPYDSDRHPSVETILGNRARFIRLETSSLATEQA